MKRWQYIGLAAVGMAAVIYVYMRWDGLAHGSLFRASASNDALSSDTPRGSIRPAKIDWQLDDRPDEGFRVELPSGPKDLQVPAYNENGGSEQVKMIVANADADTMFAVTWEDNPPVARVSRTAERTLKMARDGMLARTQTVLVSESHGSQRGDPTLDVSARNASGGVLNARFIFSGDRLYMLIALFPSESARREQDVNRFFTSFSLGRSSDIPESIPSASQN